MAGRGGQVSRSGGCVSTRRQMVKLLSDGTIYEAVPQNYVMPMEKRPGNVIPAWEAIPVVDLKGGNPNGEELATVVEQIIDAGKEFGFLQVINHGVPENVINEMMRVAEEFFDMPIEEKLPYYSTDLSKLPRLHTSAPGKEHEEVSYWRDCLKLACYPTENFMHTWPEKPRKFREALLVYTMEVRGVALKLLKLICEGLRLDERYFDGELSGGGLVTSVNHYVPCPDPSITLGVPGHCDPNLITILLQGKVNGLQVLYKENWIGVEPIPRAFVVNFGEQLEIITNGMMKSAEHRAVTNKTASRTTIASFIAPTMDSLISPAPALINEKNPPLYRSFLYKEFFASFITNIGDQEHVAEGFKNKTS
ncbi:2'-deoxymugineic-acid 2'-dioxygenase [Ananas comosus]|uniref:2'-deoxymugineic-acid 2'-dioxygenase n=1 Tax=Ananas comosus TaxID=4615 RepID=A0A199VFF9_ANACO|nr:2'-deoxymugineic-acid 2'-dioxygenase [Ananas comosus]